MRRLSLHASALSNEEYELYTSNLREISLADEDDDSRNVNGGNADDDAYFEKITVGVREARAWLRGRYSNINSSVIDSILRLFAPSLGHGDILSGSELFAVLRLVIHAGNGKPVDRSLAFVQANLSSAISEVTVMTTSQIQLTTPSTSQRSSPAKIYAELPPPMPTRKSNAALSDTSNGNPFSLHAQPPLHPSQRSESSKSLSQHQRQHQHSPYNPFVKPTPSNDDVITKLPPLPPRKPPPPIPPTSSHAIPPVPPPRHVSRTRPDHSQSPTKHVPIPLPTAKLPQHVTSTLMKQSLQASKVAQSMKRAEEQLEKERVMQVLKSSSIVSGSYSLAGASVTSSSIVVGTNIHNHNQNQHPSGSSRRSPSPGPAKPLSMYAASSSVSSASTDERAPPLPRRRIQHQSSPSTISNDSMEQVALAAAPGRTSTISNAEAYALSPFRSPVDPVLPNTDSSDHSHSAARRSLGDRPSGPPPTHPDRKPHLPFHSPTSFPTSSREDNLEAFDAIYGSSSASPTSTPPLGRVVRSKSLHQQSPPLPPLQPPPVRRRRPESVQVLGNGEVLIGSLTKDENIASSMRPPLSRNATISTPGHHRRSSLSVSSTPFSDETSHERPLSNIQRTIANLQPKLEGLNMNLDKARYKAEAGLSKRGFVYNPVRSKTGVEGEEEEGLMGLAGRGRASSIGRKRWGVPASEWDQKDVFDDPEVDDDSLDDWKRSRGLRNGFDSSENLRSASPVDIEDNSDNLKWPAGEGWKPL